MRLQNHADSVYIPIVRPDLVNQSQFNWCADTRRHGQLEIFICCCETVSPAGQWCMWKL